MALSGTITTSKTTAAGSGFPGYVYLKWTATQSAINNNSVLSYKIYGGSDYSSTTNWVMAAPITVVINGSTVLNITTRFELKKDQLIGSGTITIPHNDNGTKNVAVSIRAALYSSSVNCSYSNSAAIALTTIDRTAPTVTLTTSGITAAGVTIKATASTTCDSWDYSLNGGTSWTNFSTTSGTSASKSITGLTPNTSYSVRVRARKKTNQVYGTSATTSVKTLGGSVISSVSTLTADAATVTLTMSVTVYNTSYTHTLVIKNGSTSVLTITGLSLTNGSNTITLTAAQRSTVLAAMSKIKSFTGTFTLTTYSGSTQIGTTSSKTATVQTTAANSAPTFSKFSYADINAVSVGVTGNNQVLIQNVSTLKVTVEGTAAKNGANISSYSVKAGSTSVSSVDTAIDVGLITESGNISLEVTVIDTRGYSTTLKKNMTVFDYEKPNISEYVMRRINEVEEICEVSIRGNLTPITINGENKNNLSQLRYRYKKTSDTSYSNYTNITSATIYENESFTFSSDEWIKSAPTLDQDYSYYVQFRIDDQLSYDLITITIPQSTPLLSYRRRMIGINNRNPTAALDVVGNGKFSGTMEIDGNIISPICAENGYTSIVIPLGSDFDDYNVPNIYSGTSIGKMQNRPIDISEDLTNTYKLEVYKSGTGARRIQRLTVAETAITNTYERFYNASTWGAWYRVSSTGKSSNPILWSGVYYMSDTQTATLSQPISLQPHGIVLVFSRYDFEEKIEKNESFKEFFIPKTMVSTHPGKGHCFDMTTNRFTYMCTKYLYIYDDYITGNTYNTATGTSTTGITYENKSFVLRYVIGV